ncbi:hypothetical protein PCANC_17482 [Puccinia coronata f. sp. avenae]|uniref:Uncharacterized protein n=1 Tax=Puccinia coronata f. sp. avenae TaxID=200324 RepID=A0A2N5SSD4_9BASI|nr:hypothetical protein PCANC_17482 [Puccinia coronata f. sp. avenae]
MILILLILTVAGQSLGMASEKELVQNSAVTQGIQLACASHGALPHPRASVVDIPSESRAVKTDAEGLAHSLPSDDHESGPSKHVAITIDAEAAGGSYSNEVGQTSTLFTDLKEPESSAKAKEKQSTTAPITLTASNSKEEGSHGQMSLPTNECILAWIDSKNKNHLLCPEDCQERAEKQSTSQGLLPKRSIRSIHSAFLTRNRISTI